MTDYFRQRLMELGGPGESCDGVRALPEEFFPTSWAYDAMNGARKRARMKQMECSITATDLLKALDAQGYCCALSGIEFSAKRIAGAHKRPFMPSVDRINSSLGYTSENVRIVCVAVNTLLQDWGDEVFHEIIAASRT